MADREMVLRFRFEVDKEALTTLERQMRGVNEQMKAGNQTVAESIGHYGSLSRLAPTLGGGLLAVGSAFVGAASAAYGFARDAGAAAEAAGNMSIRTGLTVKEVGLYSQAAENAGVSSAGFTSAMRTLSHGLSEGSREGLKAKAALKELHVEAENSFGGLRSTSALWTDIGDAFSRIQDPAKQARLAVDLLGRGGLELLPVLRNDLRGTLKDLKDLGVGFDEDGARAAQRFDDSIDRLSTKFGVLKRRIGEVAAAQVLLLTGDEQTARESWQRKVDFHDSYMWASGQSDPKKLPKDITTAIGRMMPAAPSTADMERAATVRSNYLADQQKEADKEAKRMGKLIETRNQQLDRYVSELDRQGLDPLARLISGVTERLRELTLNGPLSAGQQANVQRAMQGAIGRQLSSRNVPLVSAPGPEYFGFVGLNTPTVANTVAVDQTVNDQTLASARERVLSATQRQLSFQERMVQLTAGPGGELEAIRQVADLRVSSAMRQYAITRDRGQLEAELDQAAMDRTLSIAQLRKQQLDSYKETSRGVFRALTASGGGGLKDLALGQANVLGEQLFVNTSGQFYDKLSPMLGGVGDKFGLPKWLTAGTVLEKRVTAEEATASNTLATTTNTTALRALTSTIARGVALGATGGGGVGGGIGDLSRYLSLGSSIPGMPSTAGGADSLTLPLGLESSPIGTLNPLSDSLSLPLAGTSKDAKNATALKTLGYAAGIATAGFGVYSGVRQGGGQGALTAAGSALGGLALIPGPQQPFVLAASMLTGLAAAFLGDPKKKFDSRVNETLKANRYTDNPAMDYSIDTSGMSVDYNYAGRARAYSSITVVQHFDALDAQSIIDRKGVIGEAIRQELQTSGPLRTEIADVAQYARG
ncbi:hypothetical protein [uncultured Paludibaculum sp.]|uniref:hypothetical protein n=1 Tax=uncultured Paludibaculum sp. TaxID=1765020 RepID=UPI002AAAB923|nr:hypothetical protein [uncultured Paludibaculum sp.]